MARRIRILPSRADWLRKLIMRTAYTPWPWQKCHCGARADFRYPKGGQWCWPCKFAHHPTCECSGGPG